MAMIRTLKRKVIIREYDYHRVADEATGFYYDGVSLYDRAKFIPLNQEAFEKLKVLDILKGKKHTPILEAEHGFDRPRMLLHELRDYLYNYKYCNWRVTIDEDGYMCVQARSNTPKTRLGWAEFEKDLECRL
jgi:hypothetical protein